MTVLASRPRDFPPADAPGSRSRISAPADQLLIRSALPYDAGALGAMHDRCSLDTRIARWHAPIRGIPESYLAEVVGRLPDHAALVAARAAHPHELIGLVSACRISPEAWELGMLVEDAYQRQGVGRAMLRMLVDEVIRRGGRELLAVSLDERRSVLHSLNELGPVAFFAESTTVTACVRLPR